MFKSGIAWVFPILAVVLLIGLGCQCNDCDENTQNNEMQGMKDSANQAVDEAKAAATNFGQKQGFEVSEEEGRLWILKPGEAKSEKHITIMTGGKTLKALSKNTVLEYLATRKGFQAKADEDGRLWIYRDNEATEHSEKHVTFVGAGPLGSTVKALNREVLDEWKAAN